MARSESRACEEGLHPLQRLLLHERVRPEAGQPNYIGFVAKPGHLAFGILPGLSLAFANGLLQSKLAGEDLERLFVTQRLQRLGFGREAGFEKSLGFFQQTAPKHRRRARVEALAQEHSIGREAKLENGETPQAIARDRLNMGGGLAGQQGQLYCPNEFLPII